MHGWHQVAQASTSTTLPFQSVEENREVAMHLPDISGKGMPTAIFTALSLPAVGSAGAVAAGRAGAAVPAVEGPVGGGLVCGWASALAWAIAWSFATTSFSCSVRVAIKAVMSSALAPVGGLRPNLRYSSAARSARCCSSLALSGLRIRSGWALAT